MSARHARQRLAVLLMLGAAGCRSARPPLPPPPPTPEQVAAADWDTTRVAVLAAAEAGRHAAADSLLGAFRDRRTGTTASAEAAFWRALVLADPGNARPAPEQAVPLLEAYEAGGGPQPRLVEARVVRRLVQEADSLRAALAAQRTTTGAARVGLVPRDSLRARDDELARLREALEETRAELERVRRRLAAPGSRLPR